jgi:hypothetical protein
MIPLLFAALLMGPFTASGNFAYNLYGTLDTRQQTWGYQDSQEEVLTFSPPPGFRVRITRLRGDLVAWATPSTIPAPPPPGTTAGVLLAFHDSTPDGSTRCDYCADNTPLYLQDSVTAAKPNTRAPFDVAVDWVLPADNRMIVKAASYLNTTGQTIHAEATFTVTFSFEEK